MACQRICVSEFGLDGVGRDLGGAEKCGAEPRCKCVVERDEMKNDVRGEKKRQISIFFPVVSVRVVKSVVCSREGVFGCCSGHRCWRGYSKERPRGYLSSLVLEDGNLVIFRHITESPMRLSHQIFVVHVDQFLRRHFTAKSDGLADLIHASGHPSALSTLKLVSQPHIFAKDADRAKLAPGNKHSKCVYFAALDE